MHQLQIRCSVVKIFTDTLQMVNVFACHMEYFLIELQSDNIGYACWTSIHFTSAVMQMPT